jgi:hypothetical protein
MRRSIGLLALLSVLTASGLRLPSAAAAPMTCCRGGATMACCVPGAGLAVKKCPASESVDAGFPVLPPAVVEALSDGTAAIPVSPFLTSAASSRRTRFSPPPRRPPRA